MTLTVTQDPETGIWKASLDNFHHATDIDKRKAIYRLWLYLEDAYPDVAEANSNLFKDHLS